MVRHNRFGPYIFLKPHLRTSPVMWGILLPDGLFFEDCQFRGGHLFRARLQAAANDDPQSFECDLERLKRLADEFMAAEFGRLCPALKIAVARYEYHRSFLIPFRFAYFRAELEASHSRHFDIQENRIVGILLRQLQSAVAVVRQLRQIERLLERKGDGVAADWIIVHRQNADWRIFRQVGPGRSEEHTSELQSR